MRTPDSQEVTMYVVVASATARPESRAELAQLLAGAAEASRSEDGCLSYHFTGDLENPDAFSSFEIWRDQAALQTHLAGPGVAGLLAKIGPLVAAPPTIVGYQVEGVPDQLA
ncbi:putative quinol monooxygenase [Spongisporangium articulatum]|uniref:Quinol monooxygenase n=1 Tax=Spongisporangium articulatum TaxID=3362603 RepID=A0ABW8AGS3_9ACTN